MEIAVTKAEEIIEKKKQEEPKPEPESRPERRTVELIKEPEKPSKPVTKYDIKKLY